ncbi:class I SAM-dependent methyltransferase [Persicobacter diffluens]|uniref:Methyltransferase n=1 Tax=Persicobacter diffluens TaxID=981 RepID=A0AAN4VTI0_9BACT|nr:methyltransferase [Persicobacter diffluens]
MVKNIERCPVCQGSHFSDFLACKDFTSSQEQFQIVQCDDCQFKFTNPIPKALGAYYQADSYISHTNKAQNLTQLLYKIARFFTLRGKEKLVRQYASTSKSILDFGCGTGHFLEFCQKKGWEIEGLEPSKDARNQHAPVLKGKIASSVKELGPEQVEIITLWHVLEHLEDLNETLQTLKQKLRSTGKLIIAVPNPESYDAQHYGPNWAAYDVPRHLYHFSQKSMQLLAEHHGFKINRKIPMKLDSFYVSLLSEQYKNGHQNYFSAFYTGLKSNLAARKNNNFSSLIYILEHESK